MVKWVKKYTFLGFTFVTYKLRPFGDEYHTISCYDFGILFSVELFEGKDSPAERLPLKKDVSGKTEKCAFNVAPHQNATRKREDCCVRFCLFGSPGIGGYEQEESLRRRSHQEEAVLDLIY